MSTTPFFQTGRDLTISYPVTADGLTTRIVEAGQGDRVLFCMHGVGSRADRFIPVMPYLVNAGFRVIAMDFPGHGLAAKPEGYGYRPRDFAAFAAGVLDTIGLSGVTVLGTSLGGQVGSTLACDRPDLVQNLVLIGTMGIAAMNPDGMVAAERVSDGSQEAVRSKLALVVSDGADVVEAWVREESNINSSTGARQALQKAAEALNEDSVSDLQAERLKTERPDLSVLLVWGEKDNWTPLRMGYESRDALPGSQLRIMNNCGHAPYFENPAKFTEIVAAFLGERHDGPNQSQEARA